MTCAEFQEVLPYIIESGGNAEQEKHLRQCSVCADLVADLEYIAEQAKLLLPMYDPHPRVWDGIESSLQREGLLKPARARGRLLGWPYGGAVPWIAAITAVTLVVLGITLYRRDAAARHDNARIAEVSAASAPTPGHPTAADDEALLSQVAAHHPALRNTYEDNLKQVNAYINDAKRALEQNPGDEEARQHLMDAYEQKALIYDLALSRSLQ